MKKIILIFILEFILIKCAFSGEFQAFADTRAKSDCFKGETLNEFALSEYQRARASVNLIYIPEFRAESVSVDTVNEGASGEILISFFNGAGVSKSDIVLVVYEDCEIQWIFPNRN